MGGGERTLDGDRDRTDSEKLGLKLTFKANDRNEVFLNGQWEDGDVVAGSAPSVEASAAPISRS